MENNKIKFRTVCAWCDCLISEKECPKTENRLALSQNGIIISYDICNRCCRKLDKPSGFKHKEDEDV